MRLVGKTSKGHAIAIAGVLGVALLAGCSREQATEIGDEVPAADEPPVLTGPGFADDEPPAPYEDLADMRRAGYLRVLIHHNDLTGLEREGDPRPPEIELVNRFANHLGLPIRWIVAIERDRLIAALLEGRGDMIAHAMTITEERLKQVAFSSPVRFIDEEVVVPADTSSPPRDARTLVAQNRESRFIPHIRASSAYVATLAEAAQKYGGNPDFQAIPEHLAVHEILKKVGTGEYPLSIHDSDEIQAYLSYNSDIKVAFDLNKRRPIGWATRPSSVRLLDSINAFLMSDKRSASVEETYGGDLDAIKKRGVLRVAMPNNSSSYFIYRGQPLGYQYEMARQMARSLGVRLQPIAPPLHSDMLRLLEAGRVDLIAAVLTVTPDRQERVNFSEPLLEIEETLVQPASATPITSIEGLAGQEIHVRRSSSYWRTLENLKGRAIGLKVVAADENLETESIIERVADGDIPLTVADSNILQRYLTYREDIQGSLMLSDTKPLAYAVRQDAPELLEAVNSFVTNNRDRKLAKRLYQKYFEDDKAIRKLQPTTVKGRISPYDELIRKYARKHGFDWRIIAAQMYQESGFDPKAKSWAGARGLMQIMPRTARELGVDPKDLYDPETNIAAGTLYMHRMISLKNPNMPMRERHRFALASYNAGYGHVIDARKIARTMRKNRDIWFANVEEAIVLLEDPEYWKNARHGYCRGSEPRDYVKNIEHYYSVFSAAMPLATQ
jgi:membrane-bound lytic murein transglycosylase F